jgi:hypothetical protein
MALWQHQVVSKTCWGKAKSSLTCAGKGVKGAGDRVVLVVTMLSFISCVSCVLVCLKKLHFF